MCNFPRCVRARRICFSAPPLSGISRADGHASATSRGRLIAELGEGEVWAEGSSWRHRRDTVSMGGIAHKNCKIIGETGIALLENYSS